MADDVSTAIANHERNLVELRRRLHATPELGFKERETASILADRLRSAGATVTEGIGGTGLVGVIEGEAGPGPTLMIRADIDGLPVDEATGLEFASKNGAMHACGHDGHMTMAIGAMDVLGQMRKRLKGRVAVAFQPAEEITQGGLAMFEDGLLEKTKPDRVIGLHLWNQIPLGHVGVNRGTVFAGADAVEIVIEGRGGHGAMPHLAVDPVATVAQVINSVQTIVSRELPPNEMGVVTFGKITGGTAPNVIADSVTVQGTVRAYRPEIRERILESIPRIATNVAQGMRAKATFSRLYGAPPVINDPSVADWVAKTAMSVVGEAGVAERDPVSVGDDMAEFLNRIPGTYFLLGAAKEGTEPHHNARFDFDEGCLPIGTEVFVRCALDYLS